LHGLEPDHLAAAVLAAVPTVSFTIAAIILVPACSHSSSATAMFKRRVGGTYFAISPGRCAIRHPDRGQQGYTGGSRHDDLRTLKGWTSRRPRKIILYFVEWYCCRLHRSGAIHRLTKLGRNPGGNARTGRPRPLSRVQRRHFKIFAFCMARFSAAIGGACSRTSASCRPLCRIVPSIEWYLHGGRRTECRSRRGVGRDTGKFARPAFPNPSRSLVFGLGALFIAVVLAFPNACPRLAGLCTAAHRSLLASRKSKPKNAGATIPSPNGARRSEEIVMLIGHLDCRCHTAGMRR